MEENKVTIVKYQGDKHVTLVADPKKGETFKDLKKPVAVTETTLSSAEAKLKAKLYEEYGPLEFEYFEPKLNKISTDQLSKMMEKAEKMKGAHEAIREILLRRGAITPDPVEGATPERVYKKCMPEEYLQERLAKARENYRRFVTFLCRKTGKEEVGIIRSARLDKRSGFIQYRIEILEQNGDVYTRTNLIYGKGDDSADLNFLTEELVITQPQKEENNENPEELEVTQPQEGEGNESTEELA
jgi:hypothetical protein